MFDSEPDSFEEFDEGDVISIVLSIAKWLAILIAAACLLVAPALVVYCRYGADANADGSVSRSEYDANVTAILGTGVLSYLKPVMAFWEKVVFIILPVTES